MSILLHRLKKSLNPRAWARGASAGQRIRAVTVNGQRFKVVRCPDSYRATEIERSFEAFGPSPHLPRVVMRSGNELWVEYVDGAKIAAADDESLQRIAELYAAIYRRAPRRVATEDTPYPARLQRDLWALWRQGALEEGAYRGLVAAGERLAPPRVWTGFDYTDAGLANFVLTPQGHACAVDVENLVPERLMGLGIASARTRWPPERWERFWSDLRRREVPDIGAYFAFVDLCYRVQWFKRKLLKGKQDIEGLKATAPFRDILSPGGA